MHVKRPTPDDPIKWIEPNEPPSDKIKNEKPIGQYILYMMLDDVHTLKDYRGVIVTLKGENQDIRITPRDDGRHNMDILPGLNDLVTIWIRNDDMVQTFLNHKEDKELAFKVTIEQIR